jgi:NADH:ubiquinone oxidoreductase subunit B-like Fe-S oxidoreductase
VGAKALVVHVSVCDGGAEVPRFSPRQSDLLMIVGTITEKQGPALERVFRADDRAQVRDRVRGMHVTGG